MNKVRESLGRKSAASSSGGSSAKLKLLWEEGAAGKRDFHHDGDATDLLDAFVYGFPTGAGKDQIIAALGGTAEDATALIAVLCRYLTRHISNEKDAYLHLLLRQRPGRVIVFCNAISCLRRLRALLARLQINVIALQGDMQQRARLKAVDRFVAQPQCALLATDVAARGLDVPAVDYVVRFQLP